MKSEYTSTEILHQTADHQEIEMNNLKDAGTERALLGTIVKYGKDAFIDADAIVSSSDFSMPFNKQIYRCIEELASDPECSGFDPESIKMKAKSLGIKDFFADKKYIEYLELLEKSAAKQSNVDMFALQIRKLSVFRDIRKSYEHGLQYMDTITGQEALSKVMSEAEGKIVDIMNGVDSGTSWDSLSMGLCEKVDMLLKSEPVDQVGIPTGFPLWDNAIGGGVRPGTIAVIGARSKKGKSFMALNMAINAAHRGVPVLYLDTELTKDYQQNRMVCIDSRCPLELFETGNFQKDNNLVESVIRSSQDLENNLPIYYRSISGMNHIEAMAVVRRWIVKEVGFREDGKAKECMVIYDYLKLTSGENLQSHTPEHILLGLMLTSMHDFSVKYEIPFVGFVQLNRDGIEGMDTNVVAGSDRILWLCSSLSIFKDKGEEDLAMGCGWDKGNKKLHVLESRHGSGLQYGDYINLHASLKPNVPKTEACGLIREGFLFSEVSHVSPEQKQQTRDKESKSGDSAGDKVVLD